MSQKQLGTALFITFEPCPHCGKKLWTGITSTGRVGHARIVTDNIPAHIIECPLDEKSRERKEET